METHNKNRTDGASDNGLRDAAEGQTTQTGPAMSCNNNQVRGKIFGSIKDGIIRCVADKNPALSRYPADTGVQAFLQYMLHLIGKIIREHSGHRGFR